MAGAAAAGVPHGLEGGEPEMGTTAACSSVRFTGLGANARRGGTATCSAEGTGAPAEHLVPGTELGSPTTRPPRPDRRRRAPAHGASRRAQPRGEASRVRLASQQVPVVPGHGGGVDLDEDLVARRSPASSTSGARGRRRAPRGPPVMALISSDAHGVALVTVSPAPDDKDGWRGGRRDPHPRCVTAAAPGRATSASTSSCGRAAPSWPARAPSGRGWRRGRPPGRG